jgi:putative hydrolase of the HAD superfamily
MAQSTVTHLFFDVGGVLGTDGWDSDQRATAARRFGLDATEFDQRHAEVVGMLEVGAMTLEDYLDFVVFHRPRSFTQDAFVEFMRAQSEPNAEAITVVRAAAASGRYGLATLNNESAELNSYRIERFDLGTLFDAFLSSCWLGVAKPSRRIYQLALAITQAEPERSVFIDDREQNLSPARRLGMQTVHFTTAERLAQSLRALGVPV